MNWLEGFLDGLTYPKKIDAKRPESNKKTGFFELRLQKYFQAYALSLLAWLDRFNREFSLFAS